MIWALLLIIVEGDKTVSIKSWFGLIKSTVGFRMTFFTSYNLGMISWSWLIS